MKKITPLISSLLTASALLLSTTIFAKTIPLYEQPSDTAKQVGSVDIAQGVVPIFSQKDGAWIKVGDPRNGNVGWIKANDMSGEPGSAVSFTQRIINNGNGPQTYQYIQYGPQPQMSQQQAQAFMQNIQLQQQELQNAAQQMFQNFHNWDMMYGPLFMPVVYVPVSTGSPALQPLQQGPQSKVHPTPAPVPTPTPVTRTPTALPTSNGAIRTAPVRH